MPKEWNKFTRVVERQKKMTHVVKFHPRTPAKKVRSTSRTGKYTEVQEIGRGGAATVFRGRNSKGELVAIKALQPPAELSKDLEDDEGLAASDLADLWITNSWNHPNLVHALDTSFYSDKKEKVAADPQSILRLVLPLATSSLFDYLSQLDSQSVQVRIDLAHDLLCGLSQLHGNNFAHGDVKPHNALLLPSRNDEKRLVATWTDFGSLLPVFPTSKPIFQGTPIYMSPELLCHKKRDSKEVFQLARPADMWSFGIVLLEIFLGQPISEILKTRCPVAPSDEWLAPTICLIGEPPRGWFDRWDVTGACSGEYKRRRTRSMSTSSSSSVPKYVPLLDRIVYSGRHSNMSEAEFKGFIVLIKRCLQWDPSKRITAPEALTEPTETSRNPFKSKDGTNLFSSSSKCVVDLDVMRTQLQKGSRRKAIVGLPMQTQPLTRQFANVIMDQANRALGAARQPLIAEGQSDYEFAAVLMAAKLFYDPVVPALLAQALVTSIERSVILAKERELIALLHGKLS